MIVRVRLVGAFAASVAAVALCATAASAAPALHAAPQGSFCGTAKGIVKYLSSTLALSPSAVAAQTSANLRLAYTTVVSHEGALLGSAPKSLKANLRGAFSFVNLVKADFQKASWQVANMAQYFPALVAKATANARQISAVETYLRGTCHLQV
jgi:hypothetical protein